VARAVLSRNGPTATTDPSQAVPPVTAATKKTKDAFKGKSYDFKTKEGALEHAADWHTQLLWDYGEFSERTVVTDDQLITGRAFFIYTTHYWPQLKTKAESAPPMDVVKDTIAAVNSSHEDAKTEEAAAKKLTVADYRTLFPQHFAAEYDAEAAKLRKEAEDGRDQREEYKVKAAAEGRQKDFIDWAEYQTWQLFTATQLDDEAKRIRTGKWDSLSFADHKLFFAIKGREQAREAAAKEWDAYVNRAKDPRSTWEEGHKKQHKEDLDAQSKDAQQDLTAVEVFATQKRLNLGAEVLPKNVVDAWRGAELALTLLNPSIQAGKVPPEAQNDAADKVAAFYQAFREQVASLDTKEEVDVAEDMGGGKVTIIKNPYLGGGMIDYFVKRLREAKTPQEWHWPVDQYRNIVGALDSYIADQLKAKGRGAEGEQLKTAGKMAGELAKLVERKADVKKVRAVFYPRDDLTNAGAPGTPDFRAKGIPLYFYLYREDGKWNLADVTTPHQVKVTRESGGTETTPPLEMFGELNTKLRFPHGRLYWALPDGTEWTMPTTEPWRLSEWLTYVGLAAGAVALAIATGGGTVPVTVMVIGGLAGAGAAAADLYEKSEAGVIGTQDVVVDTLSIVGNLATLGAAGLGKVVVAGALRTGPYAKLFLYADKAFVPVTLTAVGADVASFMILMGDSQKQLAEVDKLDGSEEDKKLARARIVGQLLLAGTLTMLSVKGSLPSIRRGAHLYLDVEPNGTLIARPHLSDDELLKAGAGLKSPEAVTDLLKRSDLSKDTLDRVRAAVSQALSAGKLERAKLEELLAKLKVASGDELQALLTELNSRSRIGAYLGEAPAGAVTAATAIKLNEAGGDLLTMVKGATVPELEIFGKLMGQDPKRAAALAREYGAELLETIRFPINDLDELEKALARARKEVKTQTPGFLDSVDVNTPPGALKFKNVELSVTADGKQVPKAEGDPWPDGKRVIRTTVRGDDNTEGYFERTYDPATGEVELKMAFLRLGGRVKSIPGKVEHAGTPMTPDGTPTVQYLTIYQLKRLGATAGQGAMKEFAMRDIQNVETIIQLHWLRKQYPAKSLDELVAMTASVKYARTTAVQAGYEPGPCKLHGGDESEQIRALLSFQEQGNATRIAEHKALLEKYGFDGVRDRKTKMLMGFDITFPLTQK
jgi:hypothetical protein